MLHLNFIFKQAVLQPIPYRRLCVSYDRLRTFITHVRNSIKLHLQTGSATNYTLSKTVCIIRQTENIYHTCQKFNNKALGTNWWCCSTSAHKGCFNTVGFDNIVHNTSSTTDTSALHETYIRIQQHFVLNTSIITSEIQ